VEADEALMVALQLAKIWHVTPDKILETATDLVISGIQFEKFTIEYQEKYIEMVKEDSK
jgi:hypothetical protein